MKELSRSSLNRWQFSLRYKVALLFATPVLLIALLLMLDYYSEEKQTLEEQAKINSVHMGSIILASMKHGMMINTLPPESDNDVQVRSSGPTVSPILAPETITESPSPTTRSSSAPGMACIPSTPAQTGKAIDILDGFTIKVFINDLVYTVRYLGINLPENNIYARRASAVNGELVYGKEISLIADGPDKDNLGRLLRYVIVDGTFVNLELIRQGLATTKISEPRFSCSDDFNSTEQFARQAQIGMWKSHRNTGNQPR